MGAGRAPPTPSVGRGARAACAETGRPPPAPAPSSSAPPGDGPGAPQVEAEEGAERRPEAEAEADCEAAAAVEGALVGVAVVGVSLLLCECDDELVAAPESLMDEGTDDGGFRPSTGVNAGRVIADATERAGVPLGGGTALELAREDAPPCDTPSRGVGHPELRLDDDARPEGCCTAEEGVSERLPADVCRRRLDEGDGSAGELPMPRLTLEPRAEGRDSLSGPFGVACCCAAAFAFFASFASLSKRPKSAGFVPYARRSWAMR